MIAPPESAAEAAQPASSLEVPRRQRIALAISMFLTTAVIGFLQPFVPLYLEASGLTHAQFGLVVGIGTGLALLIQPPLGRLSDRLDARRPIMCVAALISGLAYLSYRYVSGMGWFVLLSALGVNGTLYLGAAGGVLVGRMAAGSTRGGAAYAGYRVWGSVGYIVVALLTGWMVNHGSGAHSHLTRAELGSAFTYGPLLFFALGAIALLLPDRKAPVIASPPTVAASGPQSQLTTSSTSNNLARFLQSYFLYQFALYGASSYLSLYMKSLGASPLWITSTFAVGVVCEVLVMTRVGILTDRYGRRPALAVAFVLMPLRLLCYIPATGPLWVMAVQSLHGLNFGIMGAIAVVFVNDLTTEGGRGAAQARLAGVSGLATALGPAACGWLASRYGYGSMFAAMSIVGAAGAILFLTQVHESHAAAIPVAGRGPSLLAPLLRLLDAPPTGPARSEAGKVE
jgi:PPP family 3-phenylpropionic acid transporter